MPTPSSSTGAPAAAGALPRPGRSIPGAPPIEDPSRDGSTRPDGSDERISHPSRSGSDGHPSPLLDSSKIRQESSKATIPDRRAYLDSVTSTLDSVTNQMTTEDSTSTTSAASQHQQQNHQGSTQHDSTTTSYSTTERPQNTRTQQGSSTRDSNQKYLQTLVCLPNRSVWRLAAPLTGGVER